MTPRRRSEQDDGCIRARAARAARGALALVGAAGAAHLAYRLPVLGPLLARRAPFGIVVAGVVVGTVTALLAMGLVLLYRTSRFINFAYASMGSLAGVTAIGLHLERGVPFFAVLPVAVAISAATGALVELVVGRFRHATRLTLTVASIGIAQVLSVIEAAVAVRGLGFVSLSGGFEIPLGLQIDLGVKTLFGDEILILLVVPPVLAGLAWFLLRSEVGVAVRAAAENEDRALLLGIPIRRLATVVWAVAGGLAALTFVLKAPFSGVTPGLAGAGPLLLLPALAAAVVARMESLPLAFAAGVGFGVMEAVIAWNTPDSPTVQYVAFLVVVLVALLLQSGRRSRAYDEAASSWSSVGAVTPTPAELDRLPEVRWARRALVALVAVVAVVVPGGWSPANQYLAAVAVVWALAAVSLVILTGWGGHISLGQLGIVGVGALTAGNLIQRHDLDLFLALLAAGAAGAVVSLVIGLPALRIRSLFLAVTTLAFAVALDQHVLSFDTYPDLIPTDVRRPLLLERFDLRDGHVMYLTCLGVLAVAVIAAHGLRGARAGRVIVATRDNQRAADAAGVPTTSTKLAAFLVAGVISGVAGGLHVVIVASLNPHTYPPSDSLTLFATSVIGGLGSISGALVGVLLFRWIEALTVLGDVPVLGNVRPLLSGGLLLVVLLAAPGGLGELAFGLRDRALRLVARRRGVLHPVTPDGSPPEEPPAPGGDELLGRTLGNGLGDDRRAARNIPAPPGRRDDRGDGDRRRSGEPLLSCREVDVSYGPVQILFGVDLDIGEGEVVALLGTNGAGKSTLLKAISGLVTPTSGSVTLDGDDITALPADAVARRGVSLVPGGKGVFPTLTVAENLRLASWLARDDPTRMEAARAEVNELFPVLAARSGALAGDLSGGEQQMLALGGALMTRPRLLLVDELSLGLAPTVVGQMLEVVREIHRRGTTIVVVEQSVNVALQLAERALFMEKGQVRFSGPTDELLDRPDILRSVFLASGDEPTRTAGAGPATTTDRRRPTLPAGAPERAGDPTDAGVVLECAGLVKRFGGITAVDGVDLELREGQVLGLIGHNGAGKTTLLDCISGFLDLDAGRIRLRGRDVTDWAPHERALGGLGRSFQDARLYPSLTVAETIAVARERHLASRSLVAAALQLPASYESELAVAAAVDDLVELMGLDPVRDTLTGALSTGTRRIVDLACILAQEPTVLLLDEPSGGVAQKETEALGPLLLGVVERTGCSVVVIEHDMPLLRSICDELVALELGAVIARGAPAEVLAHPAVVESYLGTDDTAIERSGAVARGGTRL